MDLLFCEKPSQAQAYAKALGVKEKGNGCLKGNGLVITWAFGHIMELAAPDFYDERYKKWDVKDLPILPAPFKMQVSKDKRAQFNVIRDLLKKTRRCFIGTDFDREGEAIAREVLEAVQFRGEIYRIKCSSYEAPVMKKAFEEAVIATNKLTTYHAQQARSRADWLLGMNLSRAVGMAYRTKSKGKLTFRPSIGRVQTPMLNICAMREKEIRNFKPRDYYQVSVSFGSVGGMFNAQLILPEDYANDCGGLDSSQDAQQLIDAFNGQQGIVESYSSKPQKEYAPLPFIPSSLSVETEKLEISTGETKAALQTLYESGYVTYPRTDNPYLPKAMLELVPSILSNLQREPFFDGYFSVVDVNCVGKCWKDVDAEDAAHHGIVPTAVVPDLQGLSAHERALYELIVTRFLQQFMPPRIMQKKEVQLAVQGLSFRASSNQELNPGWKVSTNGQRDDKEPVFIPDLEQGEVVVCHGGKVIAKKTTKPKRFSQASLLVEMGKADKYIADPDLKAVLKKVGLGTEATQAEILEKEIKKGNLVSKKNMIYVPSAVEAFLDFVPEDIKAVEKTAVWEEMLSLIENGELSLIDFMDEIESYLNSTLARYS